jgi:hypothetical protein
MYGNYKINKFIYIMYFLNYIVSILHSFKNTNFYKYNFLKTILINVGIIVIYINI